MSPIQHAGMFLINVFFNAFIFVILLRFIFQIIRADFYNPISKFIVKITNPCLIPLRKIIPSIAGLDVACLVLLFAVQSLEICLIALIKGVKISASINFLISLILATIGNLVSLTISLYLYGTFIWVILSWLPTHGYNPIIILLDQLISPAIKPFRKLIPPIGGLDLSPWFFMIFLSVLSILSGYLTV